MKTTFPRPTDIGWGIIQHSRRSLSATAGFLTRTLQCASLFLLLLCTLASTPLAAQTLTWSTGTAMNTTRTNAAAVVLNDGKVLVTGGNGGPQGTADLYNPATGTWTTINMVASRWLHRAEKLPDGRVLVIAGAVSGTRNSLNTAEIYDPATNTFSAVANLAESRETFASTVLSNGKVLVHGGWNGGGVRSSGEVYDPATNTWTATGASVPRNSHELVTLTNGKVLMISGHTGAVHGPPECYLYDPAANTWAATGSMGTGRAGPRSVVLANGKVLTTGESATCELYDPATGTWSYTGSMSGGRGRGYAIPLDDGKVLAFGGVGSFPAMPVSSEIYNPTTGTWSATGSAASGRTDGVAVRLQNGDVLAAGGAVGTNVFSAPASANVAIFDVPAPPPAPTVASISPATGSTLGGTALTITGTSFTGATGVTIGGVAATGVLVSNASTITAVTPAGTAGTASVVVTTPGGTNAANTLFTYAVPNTAPTFALPCAPAGDVWTPRDQNRGWVSITSSVDGSKLAAVVYGGQIYTSTDSGATWTPRDSNRNWWSITSSADGTKLAAVHLGGQIYISTDSGLNWAPRDSNRNWVSITSSADGSKLAAVVQGGRIYTSTDSGLNWEPRLSWGGGYQSITSSADGSKLAAVENGGRIYTSTDSGLNWTARESNRDWLSITSSADGSKLAAVHYGGRIYTSTGRSAEVSVAAGTGAYTQAAFATAISPGPVADAGQTVSFTVSNNNNGLFTTQPAIASNGTLTFTPGNTAGVATVTVTAVDNGGTSNGGADTSTAQTFTITVLNTAPTNITLSPSSIAENNAANATVGALSSTDANTSDTHTFSLVSGTGSTDNGSFTITGSTLSINGSANFEAQSSYSIRVQANDGAGGTFEKQFAIAITNVNEAPTDIALSNTVIAENNAPGATIGTLTSADPDGANMHSFSLAGGADVTAFTITGDTLNINASADFEAKNSYAVRIRATDGGGLTYEEDFTVTVTDVTHSQTITFAPLPATALAADSLTLSATGGASGNPVTFSIVSGPGVVTGNVLTFTGGGTVLVRASQAGNGDYPAATNVDASVVVSPPLPPASSGRWHGLLYDGTGAISGTASVVKSALGVYSVSVKVGIGAGVGAVKIAGTSTSGTVATRIGPVTMTPNAGSGRLDVSIAGNTGSLRPAKASTTARMYTFGLASVDPIPGGGYGRASVTAKGEITLSGKTPDGRRFSTGTRLLDNDTFITYIVQTSAIPSGRIAGEFAIANLATTDVTGELAWKLPVQSKGLHLGGLETVLTVTGSLFATGGATAMNGAGTLNLSGGNLAASVTSAVTVTAGKPTLTPKVPGWNALRNTGLFSCTVKPSPTTTPTTGGGVYLPKSNTAWGFFSGSTEGGRIELTIP